MARRRIFPYKAFTLTTCPLRTRRELDVSVRKLQKCGPIRRVGVAATVLAKGDIAVKKRRFDWRKFGGSHILFSEKFIDRAGGGGGHKRAFGIDPGVAVGRTAADEDGTGSAQRDQLVRIHWQIIPMQRAGVFDEVARHPMITS